MLFSCVRTFAQEPVGEPEFIGEVIMVKPDNTTKTLDKSTVQVTTKAGASMYIVGVGKVKTRINIDGCCARVRVNKDEDFKLIIRAVDNNTDPISIVSIFELEKKSKARRAELSSSSTFGGVTSNKLDPVSFSAKKYGESSYIITLENKSPGEYGIIVRNPNTVDEKTTIVTTFGIDE
jgi:hypothetical protein